MRSAGFQLARPLQVWVVSDGRAGIENQALGLAEEIARRTDTDVKIKRVSLRSPYSWFPSGFVPAPRHALTDHSDPIAPPWPDIWIGCGRASIPLSMGVRTWSRGKTFVVQLQDPRVNPREFDLVVPPKHDELEGPNVISIIGACHRVTPEKIEAALQEFPSSLTEFPSPRFAVLIGGKSKRQDISPERAQKISEDLSRLQMATGGTLLVTLSRRTSEAARIQFRARLAPNSAVFYEGEGPNPYFAMLAAADAIFLTPDSVSIPSEAAATGKAIHILEVDGKAGKLGGFMKNLIDRGAARPFRFPVQNWSYEPLRETQRVAGAVLTAFQARMSAS
ncbi:MAG: mitochondrial fission ELM1 family protein [Caulobacterales bacterium]